MKHIRLQIENVVSYIRDATVLPLTLPATKLPVALRSRSRPACGIGKTSTLSFYSWVSSRGTLLIGKSVRDFSRTKGFIRIFEGFFLKTKGFLPKVYEIFWE